MPLHYVSKLARDNGTVVVQIGEGSDELFHGYQEYIEPCALPLALLGAVPARARAAASRAAARAAGAFAGAPASSSPHAQAIERRRRRPDPFWGGAIAYQGELKERVLTNGRGAPRLVRDRRAALAGGRARAPGADLLQKMTYLELKNRLAELLLMRVDKMTMANSVEARVPFLDADLVEFAIALPPRDEGPRRQSASTC